MHISAYTLSDITRHATFGPYAFRNAQGRILLNSLILMALVAIVAGALFGWALLREAALNEAGFMVLTDMGDVDTVKTFLQALTNGGLGAMDYAVMAIAALFAVPLLGFLVKLWWKFLCTYIARLHSWNLSGWWLVLILPVAWVADTFAEIGSIILDFFGLFKRGKNEPAKFAAEEARTYTRGARIMAWTPLALYWLRLAVIIYFLFVLAGPSMAMIFFVFSAVLAYFAYRLSRAA